LATAGGSLSDDPTNRRRIGKGATFVYGSV